MEGEKACEKDDKVRGGFAWALGGGSGRELLTRGGSRNLRACRKVPRGCRVGCADGRTCGGHVNTKSICHSSAE